VVVDVTAVDGGDKLPEVIAKLSGLDYAKIGAIAFFWQGSVGLPEAIRRDWRVVVNPRAQVPIPDALLTALESLDQSSYSGLPRKPRLAMA
jgi:hypothetical protein